ncbi:MAG: rod shape-determining protein MreC [Actinomycetota bacterium]
MMYRKSTRHRLALAALLAATATLVTLDFREGSGGPIQDIQDAAMSVVAPLQSGLGDVFRPVGNAFSSVSQIGSLRSENTKLRNDIKQLQAEQTRFPEVLRENERLKALTQQKDWVKGPTLGARVIGVGPSNQEWTVFLDKGSQQGLKEDMAVVSSEGLVGRLVLVGDAYSKVLLVTDPQHAVGSRLTTTGETGVVSGRSGEDMKFDLIDPAVKVAKGETVVTSGYDRGIYPPGIPIGRVSSVKTAADGLTKNALVRPFVKFSKLDVVWVVRESGLIVPPLAK